MRTVSAGLSPLPCSSRPRARTPARSRRYSPRVAELYYNKRYMLGSLLPQRAHYAANAVVVPAGKKKATPLFVRSVGPADFPGYKASPRQKSAATVLETATIQAGLEAELEVKGDSTRATTPFAIGSATRAGRRWALCPDTGEAYTYAVDDVSRQLARGGMDFDPCVLPSSRVCRSGGRGWGRGRRFTHAVRALRRRSARSETWFRSRAAGPVAPTLFTSDSAPPRRRDFPRLAHGARLYRDAADRWSALQGGGPCPTDLARRRQRFDALTRDYRADAQDAERERVRVRASQRAARDGEAAGRFAETRCHEC